MNTNSNTYTVIYSIILVVVVAAVLAFAAMFLKPTQEANVKKDTIGQILTAATVQGEDILATYQQEIEKISVDYSNGGITVTAKGDFTIAKISISPVNDTVLFPIFISRLLS